MKKALLMLFLAAGAYQAKAQQSFSGSSMPYVVPSMSFHPLIADSINFKSLNPGKATSKSNHFGVIAPNLKKQGVSPRFEQMLSASKPKSNMPVVRPNGHHKMPVYRAPDSVKYHMLIKGNQRTDTTAKVNP